MRHYYFISTCILIAAAFFADAEAAQIALRSSAEVAGSVVRLGDVAEVVSTDANEKYQLENLELFPVPSNGQKRYVRQREIQDLLTLSGISLVRHRFSGSSSVSVYGQKQGKDKADTPITNAAGRRAKWRAEEAICDYLKERADEENPKPWNAEVRLDDSQARTILLPGTRVLVVKSGPLREGTCRFLLEMRTLRGEGEQLEVDAELSLPNAVVATTRRLPRGVIIQPSDVELVYEETSTSDQIRGFYSINDVVGKELTQAIGSGRVIPTDIVSAPIVVRKGEIVTVVSRAAGIAVSTNARAKGEGGIGELIPIETLDTREVYYAKVTGTRELEVFAGAVQVHPVSSHQAGIEAKASIPGRNRRPNTRRQISLPTETKRF